MTDLDRLSSDVAQLTQTVRTLELIATGLKEQVNRLERQLGEHETTLYRGNGKESMQTQMAIQGQRHRENLKSIEDLVAEVATLRALMAADRGGLKLTHLQVLVGLLGMIFSGLVGAAAMFFGYLKAMAAPPGGGGP